MAVNPLPPLNGEEYERLRADIEANGIIDPVEVCDHCDVILDGWHRSAIADELRIDPPTRRISGVSTPAEHLAYALRRNTSRGHRDPKVVAEKRKQAFLDLRDEGRTQQECAGLLGVAQGTISKWEKAASSIPRNKASDARRTLTDDDIGTVLVAVLVDGETVTAVAEQFHVSHQRISQLVAEHRVPFLADQAEFPLVHRGITIVNDDTPKGQQADLAVFSPPYNVGIDYDDDPDGDALGDDEWQDLIADTMRVLADDCGVGRIVVNVPAALNRTPYRPVILPDVHELEAEIVWDKGTTGNRTTWGSWRQPTAPRLRDRTERLYVYRTKNPIEPSGLIDDDGKKVSPLISAREFTAFTQDLWTFPPANATQINHPAPFPEELPRRVIQLYGWPGCTVIDPFAGSGTTGLAAFSLGCPAVLVERSDAYCRLAYRRLLEVTS